MSNCPSLISARRSATPLRVARKPIDSAGTVGDSRPIEAVCDRMVRDFERGVTLRSIAKMYQQRVVVLEGILRDRLRALEALMRAKVAEVA